MTTSPPGKGVKTGVRSNSEVMVFINAGKAIQDGVKFHRSENNVFLTRGNEGSLLKDYITKS